MQSAERLCEASGNPDRLLEVYDSVLGELFRNPFWESGATTLRRVPWKQGLRARTEDPDVFGSPGLYIWGVERRPLYVGITRRRFDKRFARYIWHNRSQCNLAQEFGAKISAAGIDGFPPEIRDWYRRNYGGSTVRLEGAVRFAREGIDKIWFALFPHANLAEVRALEQKLIRVAEEWNESRGLRPLLNIQDQGPRRSRLHT